MRRELPQPHDRTVRQVADARQRQAGDLQRAVGLRLDMAAGIASLPAAAIAATKRCVTVGLRNGMAAGLLLEAELSVELGLSDDAAEGQQAFIEKRQPRFGGTAHRLAGQGNTGKGGS